MKNLAHNFHLWKNDAEVAELLLDEKLYNNETKPTASEYDGLLIIYDTHDTINGDSFNTSHHNPN